MFILSWNCISLFSDIFKYATETNATNIGECSLVSRHEGERKECLVSTVCAWVLNPKNLQNLVSLTVISMWLVNVCYPRIVVWGDETLVFVIYNQVCWLSIFISETWAKGLYQGYVWQKGCVLFVYQQGLPCQSLYAATILLYIRAC